MKRSAEKGTVLVQVLGLVAFASATAFIMLSLEEAAITQNEILSDRLDAAAIARGGETSVLVAFRRDGVDAPEVDYYGEPWATIAQETVAIPYGTFSVSVSDRQAKFNVNRLASGALADIETFRRILVGLGLMSSLAERVAVYLALRGEISDLRSLADAGLGEEALERLSSQVAAMPGRTNVNINTADEQLLRILITDRGAVARLIAQRDRLGRLSREDLSELRIVLPPGVGYTTNYLRSEVVVTVGRSVEKLTSVMHRRASGGSVEVAIVSRDRSI